MKWLKKICVILIVIMCAYDSVWKGDRMDATISNEVKILTIKPITTVGARIIRTSRFFPCKQVLQN